jgi:uncharacterized protein involved in exopolysaccharide biosynthesis
MNEQREWGEDGEIDLFKGVLFLWNARYLIVALTLAFALLGLAATRVLPRNYTAAADVLITIPAAMSKLVPDPVDVDAIDRLARSKAVWAQAEEQLTKDQSLGKGQAVVATRTIVDKSVDAQRPSLSVLSLLVTASTPDLARRAADTWVATVVKEEAKLAAGTRAASMEFFSRQYKEAADQLLTEQRALDQARQKRGRASAAPDADLALAEAELTNAQADFKRAGKRMDEARMIMADREAAVRAASPAALPTSPSSLSTFRIVAMGALAGFALALFIAWVASRIRSSAATPAR